MNLPEFAVTRKVTTMMLSVAICFLGAIAANSLPKERYPPVSFPQITVITDYTNAAPEEIETLITRPLEESISSVSGLRRIESVSREGKSTISVSFGWSENVDFAALAVREKIDLVKERLPKEAEDPVVLKYDPLTRPMMILSVTGRLPGDQLKSMTEHILKENIEKVEGVASVMVSGGLDREIQVLLDQGKLRSTNISILDVIDAVDTANISYPAGSIKKGLYEYTIRTVGEFRTVPEIAYTVVATDVKKELKRESNSFLERGDSGTRDTLDRLREEAAPESVEKRLVMIKDIGEVKDAFQEHTTISRLNGTDNISVSIQKQGSANTVQVAERVKRELKFLGEEIESRGIRAEIIYDQSEFIRKSIESVRDAAISGGIIIAIVLLLFFRDWVSALIVTIQIPISVIGTFFCFQLQGVSMNMMSLLGLALGSGMIVDNGIVVIENIFRLREQGVDPVKASIQGTEEVFWAVASSNLTTVAVFLPAILFVPGIGGQLFKDLAWAVNYSSLFSFFVCVTLIPMLAVMIHIPAKTATEASVSQAAVKFKDRIVAMDRGTQNRYLMRFVLGAAACFVISLLMFRFLEKEVFPKVDQGQFLIRLNLPAGSRLEATDEIVSTIEGEARKIAEVENVAVTIGSATTTKAGQVNVEMLRPHQSLMTVTLKKKRRRSSSAVVSELRKTVEGFGIQKAEVEYVLEESELQFAAVGGKPIEVEVKGYDLETLKKLTEEVQRAVRQIPGTTEILNDLGEPSPETKVEIDRKRAAIYGVSARDISLTAKAGIEGAVATQFKEAGREYDVRVRLWEEDRTDLRNLGDLLVHSKVLEVPVPLKEVGEIKQGYGPSEIRRKDQIRTVKITAAVQRGVKESAVMAKVDKAVRNIQTPEGYTIESGGKAKEVKESQRQLGFAIALALILNYMIMAAQFESFLHPLIIMLTVPCSMFGVALVLLLTGTALSIVSLFGVLILAGTVVNNSIVLIDFTNQLRREGVELVEACINAAIIRFRPILMSTLSSVIGLVPLALGIGEGAEFQAPMAIAIIGGQTCGTVFTLVVIPAFYVLITRVSDRIFHLSTLEEEPGPSG